MFKMDHANGAIATITETWTGINVRIQRVCGADTVEGFETDLEAIQELLDMGFDVQNIDCGREGCTLAACGSYRSAS